MRNGAGFVFLLAIQTHCLSVEFEARQLLKFSEPSGGKVYLVTPPQGRVMKLKKREVLMFLPETTEGALYINIPIDEEGYYEVVGKHIFGPWRSGWYGLYRLRVDGVELPTYFHGWYGRGYPPNWRTPYESRPVRWGVVYLRPPHARFGFHCDANADGGLLGTEKILLRKRPGSGLSGREKGRHPRRREWSQKERFAIEGESSLDAVIPALPSTIPIKLTASSVRRTFANLW